MDKEYITLQEAKDVTDFTETTLKNELRGKVAKYGSGSWDRKEFFAYYRKRWERRGRRNRSCRKK